MVDEQQDHGREREPAGWEQRLARRLAEPSQLRDVPEADPTPCLNCGTEVRFAFCPKCGQRRGDYRRSLFGFVRELVGETLEIDGRVARTLRLLLFRPGALTREFNEGRRQRYVSPLRMYLFATLLLFGGLSIITKMESLSGRETVSKVESEQPVADVEYEKPSVFRFDGFEGTWAGALAKKRIASLEAMSDEEVGVELLQSFLEIVPIAMFVLLPVFAMYLKVVMVGSGRFYVEHLIFSLHVHTFWSLLAFLSVLASQLSEWFGLMLLLIPGYTVFALQHAYDASWGATLVRSFLLWFVYGLTLFITFTIVFVLGALFG